MIHWPRELLEKSIQERMKAIKHSPAAFAWVASRGKWKPARHLCILSRYVSDLCYRQSQNESILVSCPPRHGKSTLLNKYLPTWYLNEHPNHNVGIFSYGAEFASEWGEAAWEVLDEYAGQLLRIKPKSKGLRKSYKAHNWGIQGVNGENYTGRVRTGGVGGPVTGRGFHLMIFDDLVKNDEEASSPVMRDKTHRWLVSTALTRLEPGGIVIGIGTRWHEDDWIGRAIMDANQGGRQWDVINFPCIAEEDEQPYPYGLGRKIGEPLWPMRYDKEWAIAKEREQGPYNWAALYQGRPAPLKGGLFEKEWFQPIDRAPACQQYVRYWDLAATEKNASRDPDFTCGILMGRSGDNYFILHMVHFQGNPNEVEKRIKRTAKYKDGQHVQVWIEQEGGASGKNLIYQFATKLAGYAAVRGNPATKSKVLNADPLSAAAAAGAVFIVTGEWNETFFKQMCVFPNAAHDDIVDATVGAFNILTRGRPMQWGHAGTRPQEHIDYKPR